MPVGPIDPCPNGPASFDEAQDPAAIRTVWSKLDLRLAGPSRAIASRGQAERDVGGNPDDVPAAPQAAFRRIETGRYGLPARDGGRPSLPQQGDRGTHEREQARRRRAGGDEGEREGEEQKRDGQGRQSLDQDEAGLPVRGPKARGTGERGRAALYQLAI